MIEYRDIVIVCSCETEFIWNVGEQKFLNTLLNNGKLDKFDSLSGEKIPGIIQQPKYCMKCRTEKKNRLRLKITQKICHTYMKKLSL